MAFTRKRLVRVHQADGPTIEGILLQRRPDYRLAAPKLLEEEDRTVPMDGEAEIPRERVLFVQLLAKSG
jgi:hypothetical protein